MPDPEALKLAKIEMRELPFALERGDAVLHYPHPLTLNDYHWMMKILERMKPRLTRSRKGETDDA